VTQPAVRSPRGRAAHVLVVAAARVAGWIFVCASGGVLAQASEPSLELSWQAPRECPTRLEVLDRVRAHVPAIESSPQRLQAFASVTRSGAGYSLVLALRGIDLVAQKQLEVDSCAAAADAAALLIALALDPNAGAVRAPEEAPAALGEPDPASATPAEAAPQVPAAGTTDETPGAPPEPGRPQTRAPAPPTAPLRIEQPAAAEGAPLELAFTLGAAVALDVGMLPQAPAWGLNPWLALSIARLRLAMGAWLWLPGEARLDRLEANATGGAVGGDLSIGYELRQSRWLLAPYGVVELLRLRISTTGISDPDSAAATSVGLGPGLHGSYRLTHELRVTADTCAILPLTRARWLVRTEGADYAVHSTSTATFRAALGLAYGFR